MSTLKIGLIGLGEVAQLMHLPLLADDRRYEIAAGTDVSRSLTEYVAKRYSVPRTPGSAADLIADPDLDAVMILTPDFLHAPLLEAAIRAGKHVFIEKPAALTAAELEPIVALNRTNPRVVFVGYMRRFAPAFTALKARLPERSEIRHVRIRDLIRESQFFVDQTRHLFVPDDVPEAAISEGRTRTQALLRSVMAKRPRRTRSAPTRC